MKRFNILDWVWVAGRLRWWKWALRELQNLNPAHDAIPEIVFNVHSLTERLDAMFSNQSRTRA